MFVRFELNTVVNIRERMGVRQVDDVVQKLQVAEEVARTNSGLKSQRTGILWEKIGCEEELLTFISDCFD